MIIKLKREIASIRSGVTFLANTPYEAMQDCFYFIKQPTSDWHRVALSNIQTIMNNDKENQDSDNGSGN